MEKNKYSDDLIIHSILCFSSMNKEYWVDVNKSVSYNLLRNDEFKKKLYNELEKSTWQDKLNSGDFSVDNRGFRLYINLTADVITEVTVYFGDEKLFSRDDYLALSNGFSLELVAHMVNNFDVCSKDFWIEADRYVGDDFLNYPSVQEKILRETKSARLYEILYNNRLDVGNKGMNMTVIIKDDVVVLVELTDDANRKLFKKEITC